MVEALGGGDSLTLVVGAGVSAEAKLPTWTALLRSLLERAGTARLGLDDGNLRRKWIDLIIGGESPLGAGAVAQALAGADLADWIPAALYGTDPTRFQPGAIAREIPRLRESFGPALAILTTNYDDLVEQSIEDALAGVRAAPFTGPSGGIVPATNAGNQRVVHLHGLLARDGRRDGHIVLSEHDYHQVQAQDWQGSEVGHALMNTHCLFLGSSLTDPNLLRYLERHAGPASPQHYAIFTRQDAYADETDLEVIEAREAALRSRWQAANLEIIFVDYYAEIAQAVAEVARAKTLGSAYVSLPARLAAWHEVVDRQLLASNDATRFGEAQDLLHDALREALQGAVETVRDLGYDPGDEVLAASMWLVDASGETLTNWATTDRVHRDPATIDPVEIAEHSRWLAIRAFCRGAPLGEPRDIYASRWRYIRALPLRMEELPVGTLTITSMRPQGETMLDTMPGSIEAAFDDALREATLDILELAFT